MDDGPIAVNISGPHLRKECPCAGCRKAFEADRSLPYLEEQRAGAGFKPVVDQPVGYNAYKMSGATATMWRLFTLEHLRELCKCPQC